MTISASKLSDSLTQLQQLFTKSDTNKNGTLNKTEFAAAAKGIEGLSGATDAETTSLFNQMDTDKNGELTTTELTSGLDLADKVKEALLKAQELMSGKSLLDMIGGNTSTDNSSFLTDTSSDSSSGSLNLADILSKTTSTSTDATSTDTYTSMLQQIIAKYNATAAASTGTDTATTTPIDTQA